MARKSDDNTPSLFGNDPSGRSERSDRVAAPIAGVSPADADTDLANLGEGLSRHIFLGTSSWGFPGWRGIVWRDALTASTLSKEGLPAYSRFPLFRTVGIDKTFYRPAPASEFSRLAAQVPEGFRFLIKAHEAITRRDADASPSRWLDSSYASDEVVAPAVSGLASKLGPIVFQFSPMGLRRDKDADEFIEDLGSFLSRLPKGPLYAVEIRDRRALRGSLVHALNASSVAYCFNIHPSMPSLAEQARVCNPADGPALVIRWMLHSGLGYDEAVDRYTPFNAIVDPDPVGRRQVVDLLRVALGARRDAWVIVNNKAEGSAPLSIVEIARALASN